MSVKDFFGMDREFFRERGCADTSAEIAGQPLLWRELGKLLLEKKRDISDFIGGIGDLRGVRIILTGAGSSAFIGEALSCFLAKSSGIKCEAIHTTDIVSAPGTVLFEDIPTLLVSFGRSGNSPESVGAVSYARKLVKNLYEVAIVCDSSSKLYDITGQSAKSLTLLMPEGSNDKGFAMTASVSCMLLAGFALFNGDRIDGIVKDIELLAENVAAAGAEFSREARELAEKPFDRAVYLGSGGNKGLAHEGSLKMLELTNGAVSAYFDSAAGFRHGPKTIVKDRTLSLHLISADPFTARYDVDLLNEMYGERAGYRVVALLPHGAESVNADCTVAVPPAGGGFAAELCAGIAGLVFFQILAVFKSLALGVTTDNPSPSGQVNRVVRGVTVYPL